MVVCFWFQNFSASRLLSSIPVTLYRKRPAHRQGLEQRFGMLAEYSYSPENVRKTHAFGHSLNYHLIIFIAIFPQISWETVIFDYIHMIFPRISWKISIFPRISCVLNQIFTEWYCSSLTLPELVICYPCLVYLCVLGYQ